MRKYVILLVFGIAMVVTFNSCVDPMDDIQPLVEEPQITTDGTGDGSGPEKDKPGNGE